jgi:hypothetical protein
VSAGANEIGGVGGDEIGDVEVDAVRGFAGHQGDVDLLA